MSMDFSKLLGQIDSVTSKKNYAEDSADYWKPTKDKAGNASAVIRFLPNKDVDDFPFIRMWSHSFRIEQGGQAKPRWYIENSLSTIGLTDYIGEVNQELWNTGIEENQKIVKTRKRKLQYISNIYVIKDLGNPENNGKTFKYKYGQKIFEKIVGAAKPDEALGEQAINAFDVYGGADFLLKMQKANDQFNYDASKFGAIKGLLGGDDDAINEVLAACHDLNLEVAPDKFKTYEELKKKFLWVTGQESKAPTQDDETTKEIADLEKLIGNDDAAEKSEKPAKAETNKEKPKATPKKVPAPVLDAGDGDDDAAFFASLTG